MENWTIEETKRLFRLAADAQKAGKGLRSAFERCAAETGRKPNSVRNYYYSQMKALTLLPEYSERLGIKPEKSSKSAFVMFEDAEIKSLIRGVLIRQAAGESVRAITTSLSGGDKSLMLRLQNKYRSVVFNRRPYVETLMREMRSEKLTYFNPYTKRVALEGVEDKNVAETAVENVNELLKQFFSAQNEKDKIDRLSDYMTELGKILSKVK